MGWKPVVGAPGAGGAPGADGAPATGTAPAVPAPVCVCEDTSCTTLSHGSGGELFTTVAGFTAGAFATGTTGAGAPEMGTGANWRCVGGVPAAAGTGAEPTGVPSELTRAGAAPTGVP
jgi:hypothetical protein